MTVILLYSLQFQVTGDCGWVAFSGSRFRGPSVALRPGVYEAVPELHRKASSLRKVLPESKSSGGAQAQREDRFVARAWAFLAIHAAARELDSREAIQWTKSGFNFQADFGPKLGRQINKEICSIRWTLGWANIYKHRRPKIITIF